MLKKWIILLFLPIALLSNRPSTPRELASLQPEPSALINGCVHAITGDFIFEQPDMIIRGAQEIVVPRRYISSVTHNENSIEDQLLPHRLGTCSSLMSNAFTPYELFLMEPNGMQIFYLPSGIHADANLTIYAPAWGHHIGGISGYCKDTLGNSYHPKNNVCYKYDSVGICLVTSTGEKRLYKKYKTGNGFQGSIQWFLRLENVILSNNILLHYDYRGNHLYQIKAIAPSSGKVLSQVKFKDKDGKIQANGSDKSWMTYEFKIYKKKKIKKKLIKRVMGNLYPKEELNRAKHSLRISARHFPKNRSLFCNYDKEGRVTQLCGPQGILAKISYTTGTTTSIDRGGNKTLYLYDQKTLRLNAIHYFQGLDTLLKIETYKWTPFGCLQEKSILSSDETPLLTIQCKYNAHLDLIEKTIKGDQEYTFYYKYNDRFLLQEEREDNGNRATYTYVEGTNLPEEICTYKYDHLLKRTQYHYNEDYLLEKEITDAGGAEVFTKVIERKQSKPFYGMPEFITEKCNGHLIQKTRLHYDEWGNVKMKRVFGSNGKLAYVLETIYNEKGQIIHEVDAEGYRTRYSYDENGNLKYKTTSLGLGIFHDYDNANRLICKIEMGGNQKFKTEYRSFDALDHPQEEIDPLQAITYRKYDALGNLISVTNPQGHTTTYEYDALGNKTAVTDALGRTTKITYNHNGSPLVITHADGSTESYTYNPDGTKASYTNEIGLKIEYTYDIYGNLAKEKLESSAERTWTYDAFYLHNQTNLDGYTTYYKYDPLGRKVQETYEGIATHFTYDPLFRIASEQTGTFRAEWTYDKLGRTTSEKAYEKNTLISQFETTYNAEGSPLSITNYPNNQPAQTIYEYDVFGREISHTTPLGHQTITSYQIEPSQKVITITEPGHLTETQTYNTLNQLVSLETKDPEDHSVSRIDFTYYPDGKLQKQQTTLRDKTPHILNYTYDLRGRKASESESNLKTTRYSYYADGKLKMIHKPDGVKISHAYNPLGQLVSLKSSKGDIDYSFTYTKRGALILAKDLIHQTQTKRIIDPYGNIREETLANGLRLQNTYDIQGRRINLTLPENKKIHYTYAGPNPTSVETNQLSHSYKYDRAGNLTQECHIDGTSTEYLYDEDNRLLHRISPHIEEIFQYDDRSNPVEILENGIQKTYSYDFQDHLTSEPDHTYEYDTIHNRTQKDGITTTFSPLNQESHLQYDLNGNLKRKGQTQLQYDSLDRLIKVITPNEEIHYTYDSEHRRIMEKDKSILWDGQHELGTLDCYRILGRTNLAEIGSAVAIVTKERILQPIHTARGDLIKYCSTEKSLEQNFTTFGEGEAVYRWGYRSKTHDKTSGLIYFGRRYYDPALGRFITSDPEGYTDSANLYAYALNNPLTLHDPYGLFVDAHPFDPLPSDTSAFDPNQWKITGAALRDASIAFGRDTFFALSKYGGGVHGPEDMSYLDIYNATNSARDSMLQASENWMLSSPYAGTDLYHFIRETAYTTYDTVATCLLPFGKAKAAGKVVKTAVGAEKIAHGSPTLLKAKQIFGKLFKSSKSSSHLKDTVKPIWTSTKKKSSVKNAFGHWKDHGKEFPELINAKQYVEFAHRFCKKPPVGTLKKVRPNGEILLYDVRSNTFGAFKPDGVPKTLFKPKEGIKYWNTRN